VTCPAVVFGDALAGPANSTLRERVVALAAGRAGAPLRVDTVLALHTRAERADFPANAPSCWLLLDFHRWVLFEESTEAGAPRIGSVVRFLVDAYPVQPLSVLRDSPYRFLYPPDVLDVLPLFWTGPPGIVVVGDLVTGEILHSPAQAHPAEERPRYVAAASAERVAPPPLVLGETWTDAGLRSGTAPSLGGLLSAASGIVRERTETTDHASLPYSVVRVSWKGGVVSEFCGGKALRPSDAALVAGCEALERFQTTFARPGETLVSGSYAELRGRAVDPRDLFFPDVPAQGTMLRRWTEDAPTLWTMVDDPLGGRSRLVPVDEVWFNVGDALRTRCFVAQTTSGCALGGTVEEAAGFALLEAVERDAFLTTWYLRRSCARIDPDSVASEEFQLLRHRWEAAFGDYDFFLFNATSDVGVPAVIGVAARRRGDGPRAFVSAAARLCAERACLAALKDLTGFLPLQSDEQRRAYRASLERPDRIYGPAGHFETYAMDEAFARLEFLDFGATPRHVDSAAEVNARALLPPATRMQPREMIRSVATHLRTVGAALYLKDLTHPALTGRGLRCVRAVTPGLYPMWFGTATRRFAVTERLRRLSREWNGQEVEHAGDCNLEVHPLA